MSKAVVVGGGISGLIAAKILRQRHDDITIVERQAQVGGLLRSEVNGIGHIFDQGTHFILPTSIEALNELLFEDLSDEECFLFSDSLLEGSYFNGQLSVDSGCIDVRSMPQPVVNQALFEILNTEPDATADNLKDHLTTNYGPTLSEMVFAPIVEKFAGVKMSTLLPGAAATFATTRLILLDRFGSAELKKSPFYDVKIAWAHRDDGSSDIVKRYPKKGGVGCWVEKLENRLREDGVKVYTGCSVSDVIAVDDEIKSLQLHDGQILECDEVVWTIPPVHYLRTVGIELDAAPPTFRNMVLLNFSIDQEVNTNLHWVVCYDPNMVSFRVTLYPNITLDKRVTAPHHLTVEVITEDTNIEALSFQVFGELKMMGLVPDNANIIEQSSTVVSPGWPILTSDFVDGSRKAYDLAVESASNITFVGRGKGEDSHFQYHVLENLYQSLT